VSLNPVEVEGDDAIVAEINVTPLTDIFLVLLIIFMVTSSVQVESASKAGLKVNLPRAGSGGGEPSGVIVTATADQRVEVNGKSVALDGLRAALETALLNSPEHTVILQGDRSVVLERAVQIMTIAKEAGAERISIATAPAKN
jgi:biopolymer transport protein ExbD